MQRGGCLSRKTRPSTTPRHCRLRARQRGARNDCLIPRVCCSYLSFGICYNEEHRQRIACWPARNAFGRGDGGPHKAVRGLRKGSRGIA